MDFADPKKNVGGGGCTKVKVVVIGDACSRKAVCNNEEDEAKKPKAKV